MPFLVTLPIEVVSQRSQIPIFTHLEAFSAGMRVSMTNCSRRHGYWWPQSRCLGGLFVPLKEVASFILAFRTHPKETPFVGPILCDRTLNGVPLTLTLTRWYHSLILDTSKFGLGIAALKWITLTERLAPMLRFAGISGVGPVLC